MFTYGVPILPGNYRGQQVTEQDIFEAVGKHSVGEMSDADLDEIERVACPPARGCGAQFTANPMATVSEAIGLPLPYSPGAAGPYESRLAFGITARAMRLWLSSAHSRPRDTGRKIAENVKSVKWNPHEDGVRPADKPITVTGGVVGLKGNLAPEGAIVKVAGMSNLKFTGPARCFDCEEDAFESVRNRTYKEGEVIVIRYEGPRGGPGMREMLSTTAALTGQGMGAKIALITDSRFSVPTHGVCIGHVGPGADLGGPVALLPDGDIIEIDANVGTLSVTFT